MIGLVILLVLVFGAGCALAAAAWVWSLWSDVCAEIERENAA